MDPALSILDRALKGDAGALSFLERTTAIYVYDCTNPGPSPGGNKTQPKICGAWDFLNQALTEVERCEARMAHVQAQGQHQMSLGPHVQLLATMSRRAARRCPVSDQKLVEVCLSNAAHFHEHGSNEFARHLIQLNQQMRDRVMGRIATITFDFVNHPQKANNNSTQTVFSNPVTMDSLCAVVAANAISSGPNELRSLVMEWIIPSRTNMPPFSVAAVVNHLAIEAMGKSAPVGTNDAIKNLFDPILSKVLAPMLQEAIRESDHGGEGMDMGRDGVGDRTNNHRIASMALQALERWCTANSSGICLVKQVCEKVKINIVDVISDAMYSDSEIVMDALSELLDTLLRKLESNRELHAGVSLAGNIIKGSFGSSFALQLEKDLAAEAAARDEILSELVSAVGLQRFRFSSRLSSGDSGVCRCLTSIARSIAEASQPLLRSGKLQGAERGMVDLLVKAASHPSLNVYSIALDTFKFLINASSDLPTRLLPILQGRAIAPPCLVGLSSDYDVDIDFHEFERFREHQLTETLSNCYVNCRSYYMESCCIAIEEFCSSTPTPHTSFQLEAALFCLCAVSFDASKRALLSNASPAAQAAAARACASQMPGTSVVDVSAISEDAKHHDEKLSRCIIAVSKCQGLSSFNNPLFLSQLCRLLGRYANWLSKSSSEGVLDAAAGLALSCFNEAASTFGQSNVILQEMSISPFTEAATALRNILSRAPTQFANAEALNALENGWRAVYSSPETNDNIPGIDDRKALCTGITRVLAVLPPDQWPSSLSTLATPTIECIEVLLKAINAMQGSKDKARLEFYISRMGDEICIFATALRTFHNIAKKQRNVRPEQLKSPLLSLLHRVWPCVTHIARTFSTREDTISSLSEFLLIVISLNDDGKDVTLLKEASDIAAASMDASSRQQAPCNISAMMYFVEEVINIFGHKAETQAASLMSLSSQPSNEVTHQMHCIVESLLRKSFSVIRQQTEQINVDALPGLFAICKACIGRCPILFMSLHVSTEPSNSDRIFPASLSAAISYVASKRVDVVRAALLYLNEIFLLAGAATGTNENQRSATAKSCAKELNVVSGDLVSNLINGACGIFPYEVLDPVGNLLYSILKSTDAAEAEQICTKALQKETFRLGDDAKRVTLLIFGKGTQDSIAASVIMDLLGDIWNLHQNDDTGGLIAGGDAILSFTKKYTAN